jgi:hypothetical protein
LCDVIRVVVESMVSVARETVPFSVSTRFRRGNGEGVDSREVCYWTHGCCDFKPRNISHELFLYTDGVT